MNIFKKLFGKRSVDEKSIERFDKKSKEDISIDEDSGEILINNKPYIPFQKEYWIVSNNKASPDISKFMFKDDSKESAYEHKTVFVNEIPEIELPFQTSILHSEEVDEIYKQLNIILKTTVKEYKDFEKVENFAKRILCDIQTVKQYVVDEISDSSIFIHK